LQPLSKYRPCGAYSSPRNCFTTFLVVAPKPSSNASMKFSRSSTIAGSRARRSAASTAASSRNSSKRARPARSAALSLIPDALCRALAVAVPVASGLRWSEHTPVPAHCRSRQLIAGAARLWPTVRDHYRRRHGSQRLLPRKRRTSPQYWDTDHNRQASNGRGAGAGRELSETAIAGNYPASHHATVKPSRIGRQCD
jgi:hypothetical protein